MPGGSSEPRGLSADAERPSPALSTNQGAVEIRRLEEKLENARQVAEGYRNASEGHRRTNEILLEENAQYGVFLSSNFGDIDALRRLKAQLQQLKAENAQLKQFK